MKGSDSEKCSSVEASNQESNRNLMERSGDQERLPGEGLFKPSSAQRAGVVQERPSGTSQKCHFSSASEDRVNTQRYAQ